MSGHMGRVLIQVALNGGTTRAEHAAVPITPDELAAEARAAQLAGAGAFHAHPRDAAGAQTLEPEHVLASVAAVRAATGLPVGVTTGIWTVDGNESRRLELVAGWTGTDRPDYDYLDGLTLRVYPGADARELELVAVSGERVPVALRYDDGAYSASVAGRRVAVDVVQTSTI